MSGYYPDGVNQAIFDQHFQTLDDEPEVIGSCELCGDDLTKHNIVVVNGRTFCIDCSEGIRNGDEI